MVGLAQPVYAFHYNITHNGRLFRPNHRPIPTVVVSRHLFAFFSAARRGAAPCECDAATTADGCRRAKHTPYSSQRGGRGPSREPRPPAAFVPFVPLRGGAAPTTHHLTPPPVAISTIQATPARPVPTTATAYPQHQVRSAPPPPPPPATVRSGAADVGKGSAMSFADLEAGALRAPVGRKARGGPNDARGLVFQITTAVASYRRLLNSLGTPKDTPTLRDHLSVLELLLRVLTQESDKPMGYLLAGLLVYHA